MHAKIREYTAPLIWNELVGPQIAAATEVDRVKDGILFVHTRSAMWAHELTFHKADILRRLNQRLGMRGDVAPVIKDLRFQNRGLQKTREGSVERTTPLHPTPEELDDVDLLPGELAAIEQAVSVISDPRIRTSLRLLRIADARLRTWRLDHDWAPCETCGDLAPAQTDAEAGKLNCPRCRLAWASMRG